MQTDKERAEKYVRSKCPELMELSFGCKILKFDREMIFIALTSYDNGSHSLTFRAPNGTVHNGTYYTNEIEELIIIGHPIQLQHWLRVLKDFSADYYQYEEEDQELLVFAEQNMKVWFNLTTGQPSTEADYHAFNKIVGI